MFVSRGIGTMTFIPRIFNRPHIIVVELAWKTIAKLKGMDLLVSKLYL
jgi:hypothetical protein